MLRVGVIGCGAVANFGHLPAIERNPGIEVAALHDPDRLRLAETAAKCGQPPTFTDFDHFLATPMDAVAICSPPAFHRHAVEAALGLGLHVLCEKPLAEEEPDALAIASAAERARSVFAVGFVYRYAHVARRIRNLVANHDVGEVRALRLVYTWNLHGRWEQDPDGTWVESPRWRGRMLEGGPLVDCGVHQIDLARWWLGSEVIAVDGFGAWVSDYEAPDHVWCHLDHANGAHTLVEVSFTYGHTAADPAPVFSYELIGSGGVIRYDRQGWRLEIRDGRGTTVEEGSGEKDFDGMYQAFAHAIATGDTSEMPTAADGIEASRIAWSATRAAIAKRPVGTLAVGA